MAVQRSLRPDTKERTMEQVAEVEASMVRMRAVRRGIGCLFVLAFAMQLEHGSGLLGSLIFSPLVVLQMFFCSVPVSLAWLLAAAVFMLSIRAEASSWALTLRKPAIAIALGLTPHLLFLTEINVPMGSFLQRHESGWPVFIDWYETEVSALQDRVGDYLMPTLAVGTALSLALFLVARWLDSRRFEAARERIQDGMRFAGMVLVSATAFTVLTSMPIDNWQPDARQVLQAKLAASVKEKLRLALYAAVRDELRVSDSPLRVGVHAAVQGVVFPERGDVLGIAAELQRASPEWPAYGHDEIVEALEPVGKSGHAPFSDSEGIGRLEARKMAGDAQAAAKAADRQVEALRKEIEGICAGIVGSFSAPFVGDLLAILVEDAATRVMSRLMRSWQGSDEALGWVVGRALPRIDEAGTVFMAAALGRIRSLMANGPAIQSAHQAVRERARAARQRAQDIAIRARARPRGARR
jgi:hypothetical protein